jgi:hypothetical protein
MGLYHYGIVDLSDEDRRLSAEKDANAAIAEICEGLRADESELKADIEAFNRRIKLLTAEADGIESQLRSSGYEEAVKMLGERMRRMKEITACRDILLQALGKYGSERNYVDAEFSQWREKKEICSTELAIMKQAVADESALGYTQAGPIDTENRASVDEALNTIELNKHGFVGKGLNDMEAEIHRRLLDSIQYFFAYDMGIVELFEQPPDIAAQIKRIDITCQLDGQPAGLHRLHERLKSCTERQRQAVASARARIMANF